MQLRGKSTYNAEAKDDAKAQQMKKHPLFWCAESETTFTWQKDKPQSQPLHT